MIQLLYRFQEVTTIFFAFLFMMAFSPALFSQTIEEKFDSYLLPSEEIEEKNALESLNNQLFALRKELKQKYDLVNDYYKQGAEEDEFKKVLSEVNTIRDKMRDLEQRWRELATRETKGAEEGYAFWDEEDTTLSQLIMEYGSSDYLYVIPPDILSKKLHLYSGIPVPRESWSELMEIILSQSGIGIRQLNPYTRQLYFLKEDLTAIDQVLTKQADLAYVPDHVRIAYIFSPPVERMKGVCQFFNRFRDIKRTFVYQIGNKIAIIALKEEVQKLLALYEGIWQKENEKVAEVLSLSRLSPQEMEKIVYAYFDNLGKKGIINRHRGEGEGLTLIPLKEQGSLVLIGPKEMVTQAKKIVKETEKQIMDPMEMTVYWYTCRHSDPADVAEALEKVYAALIYSGVEGESPRPKKSPMPPTRSQKPKIKSPITPSEYGPPPYSSVAHPLPVLAPTLESQKERSYTTNFIPYPKTGSIMIVVRRDTLDKVKELLRKIDIPKKMVQIEVLFFEKKLNHTNKFGLNMFNWGAAASNQRKTSARYDQSDSPQGIMSFLVQRKAESFWGTFDIAYNFLMAQDDVRINAAPWTVTLNQTPAKISVTEEISISNGAAPISNDNVGKTVFEESFSRAQYGITMVITPTIHDPEEPNSSRYFVTLETSIDFDTFNSNSVNRERPDVTRRKITNFVRVLDGETVILGGLRRKDAEDVSNSLPFLGEIPGIGKLFGNSEMKDRKTEMFVFITPRIIFDADEDVERLRREQLCKRPGDLPEFVERVEAAKRWQKEYLFENSVKTIFGKING